MRIVIILLAALLSTIASANLPELDACQNMSTNDQLECLEKVQNKYDAILNSRYQACRKNGDPQFSAYLRRSEQGWVTFKDNECQALRAWEPEGSLSRLTYAYCKTEKTVTRANDLEYCATRSSPKLASKR